MLSIFIMLIIAIGLCAGIGYSILTLIKTGEVSLNIQKNQVRMEVIAGAIRSNLIYRDGYALIPVDLNDNGQPLARVPSVAPYSVTSYGKKIVYCPVSPIDAAGLTTQMRDADGNASYTVQITEEGGKSYISGGAPDFVAGEGPVYYTGATLDKLREKNVVALLISPDPNLDAPTALSCGEVKLSNDGNLVPLIDGGSVTSVYKSNPEPGSSIKAYDVPLGDGTVALSTIAETTSRLGLPETVLNLPTAGVNAEGATDGSVTPVVTVSSDSLSYLAGATNGRVLRIEGSLQNPAVIRVIDLSIVGKAELGFSGDVYMDNVTFEGYAAVGDASPSFDVVLSASKSGRLFLNNVVVGGLHVDGGRIAMSGDESLVSPAYGAGDGPVVIEGGDFSLSEASGAKTSVMAPMATVVFDVKGGRLLFDGLPVVDTSETSKIVRATGNARIASTVQNPTVAVRVIRGALPIAEETVYSATGVAVSQSCADGSGSCEATCPEGTTAVSGSCGSSDGHALAGFGFGANNASYNCAWASPIETAAPTAPTATAICR